MDHLQEAKITFFMVTCMIWCTLCLLPFDENRSERFTIRIQPSENMFNPIQTQHNLGICSLGHVRIPVVHPIRPSVQR
jgi:hypothetical protein